MTGDPRYGDHLERVIYNTVLGVKQPDQDGDYPYYSTYGPNAAKVWYPRKWPCCSGTLVQGVADYVLGLYLRADDGITINMYAPSELRTQQVKLAQTTAYPAEEMISIRVETSTPQLWTMRLRIPAWLEQPAQITVNGVSAGVIAKPGSFAALHRRWRSGGCGSTALAAIVPRGADRRSTSQGSGGDAWPCYAGRRRSAGWAGEKSSPHR